MILKMKLKLNQFLKLMFFISLTNISSLYSHNLFNGGCKDHCEAKIKEITKEKNFLNSNYHNLIDSNDSCLNKSLCRG